MKNRFGALLEIYSQTTAVKKGVGKEKQTLSKSKSSMLTWLKNLHISSFMEL
jgi:hypothetical protein